MIPTISKTITCAKKVTHVITDGDDVHLCSSATHVCDTLRGLGHETTPAIVYRLCSKNANRKHRGKIPLPDTYKITRACDYFQ